jgi:hypothetical protein
MPPDGAARSDDEVVTLGVTKEAVDGAPHIAADGELSPDEERRLYEHYDIGPTRRIPAAC